MSSVDLFICGVSASAAYEMLQNIIDSGYCKTSFILSGGFGETEHGKELEHNLRVNLGKQIMNCQVVDDSVVPNAKYPLLNGANTLGYLWKDVCNTIFVKQNKSSSTDLQSKRITTPQENIALLCQSGACMISRLSDMAWKCSPLFSMSVGN